MKTDLMNIIFGMKVRKARSEMGLSLSAFAARCDISPSYLTEIEKGRKYPKRDKILKIAEETGIDYDELVSIRLGPSLAHLESALQSPLMSEFPFDEFGIDLGAIVDVLTTAPDRVSALIHALLEMGRRYDMKEEHFLRAALRSYQELHDNHFPDIEAAAEATADQFHFDVPVTAAELERVLVEHCQYDIDLVTLARHPELHSFRSVVVKGQRTRLLINDKLSPGQRMFLMAREIGHHKLDLRHRAYTSPPVYIESFEQVLNDFKASYFAGALMMPREEILADIGAFFALERWQPQRLLHLLDKYQVSPEMLCYRLSELIPQYFGVDLHFLRFNDNGGRYRLVKQLNLNQLPLPNGFGLNEAYCRRWLTVRLLRELEDHPPTGEAPHVDVQMSEFLNGGKRFLCFGFSRPLALTPGVNTSVILGFRVTPDARNTLRFMDDPSIPMLVINDTCERCPLTEAQCSLRAAEPRIYEAEQQRSVKQRALQTLMAEIRS